MFELNEYTLLFFLGSVHAGIFPSTMMNNFIVTQVDFVTTSTESYHYCHSSVNVVVSLVMAQPPRLPLRLRHILDRFLLMKQGGEIPISCEMERGTKILITS